MDGSGCLVILTNLQSPENGPTRTCLPPEMSPFLSLSRIPTGMVEVVEKDEPLSSLYLFINLLSGAMGQYFILF